MMKKVRKSSVRSTDEKVVCVIAYIVMTILALFAFLPLLMLFSASISSEASLAENGYGFFPKGFSLDAYRYIWEMKDQIFRAYGITILVTVVGTALSIILTSMLAYGLIQKNIPGKGVVMVIMVISLLFNGGIVSSYIVWSDWFKISNTIFALIFPNLLMNGFSVILVMSYFRTAISPELLEAARMDGASEMGILFKIVIPLSTPILATIGLMEAIAYWNDWTNGLYYIDGLHENLYSIQLLLNNLNQKADLAGALPNLGEMQIPSTAVRMAIAFIGILPILIAYPFFQKYFAKGLTLGGVKG